MPFMPAFAAPAIFATAGKAALGLAGKAVVGAAIGYGVSKAFGAGKGSSPPAFPALPPPQPAPQAPTIDNAEDKARASIKRKKSSATDTIFGNPLGLAGEAEVIKTKLGGY